MSAQRQGSWGLLAPSFGYGLCVAAWGAWVLGYTDMHETCRGCLGWETQVTRDWKPRSLPGSQGARSEGGWMRDGVQDC